MTDWAKIISDRRKVINMRQSEVAELAGIPLRTYARYEKGERVPDMDKARRIEEILGTHLYSSPAPNRWHSNQNISISTF